MAPEDYAQFVLALIFVLGLIGIGAALLRRFGPGAAITPRIRGDRRLKIIEALPLDPRRRLVLVRRDGKEHLILLGQNTDFLIEGDIDAPEDCPEEDRPVLPGVTQRFDTLIRRMGQRGNRE
jgi:flagellar protein FliO/FliZ